MTGQMMYITPRQLEEKLVGALHAAGYKDATALRGTRYVTEDDEACLKASVHQYASVIMPHGTLEGYERVLRELPGVQRTQIVHEDPAGRSNPLRDQVIVIHQRMWVQPPAGDGQIHD